MTPPAAAKPSSDKDSTPVLQRQQQAGGDQLVVTQDANAGRFRSRINSANDDRGPLSQTRIPRGLRVFRRRGEERPLLEGHPPVTFMCRSVAGVSR